MCSIPGLPSTGSNVPVLITRVNLNPSCVLVEFWGNFDQDRKFAYQQLKKEIQYPKESFCESDGNPGDLCLVQVYETWYRARIVSRDTDEYSVFLIDEGRTLRATVNTLAWGKSDFFYLPPEVEFCVLANVLPLSPENRWSTMALEFMKTFCGRRVNASVQDVLVPHRTFLLDIPCLSRQMFEMGFAKKLYSDRFKEFVSRSLQPNNGSGELQRISSVRTKPLEIIEQIEKQQAYMYPELQTDTVETVVVTEVTSPFRIFCQLKVFSQELKKLTEQITQHYEGRIGSNFARPENLGSPCSSRGCDGKWYRSVLQQVMSANNVAEILQVDYGKKQFVQVENVRPLASEFFRMPVVTYVCSLHGIVDRGVGWTASQIDYLKSLLLNRTVIAKFQYQSLSEGVHYVTLYGEENTNINQLFELKQKCTLDSDMTLADFAVQKSPSSLKSKISGTTEYMQADETYSDPKGNKPVFFTENLTSDTSHVVVVQHVESPGKFWIQTQRYADEFNELMTGLGNLYGDPTSTEGLIRKPVVSLLCAAKAHDGVFYRAAIYKVMEKTAEVYFLDYGNTELVDCFNLRQLPLRFQQLPAVAVKCSLHGIKPRLKNWDERATSFFSKLVEDKVLDLHIQDKHQDTHMVHLVDPSLDGENDVGKQLCNANFASSVDTSAERSCGLKPHMSGIFFTGTRPQTPSSSTQLETASAFKEYLFPIGSSLEVTVSYIESPNDFWCQKARNAACLEVLMQDIQRFYAHSEFVPPLEAACVARHPDTGIWYRALIIQKHQTPHVEVLFVDYGQTKKVAVEDLRKISPPFLKMKGQAFRCSLYNLIHPVSHAASDWSPDATLQFQKFVDKAASMNVPLKCTIFAVMYDSQKVVFNVVDLETPFQSICNLLVQKRLADRAPSKRAPHSPFRLDTYYYSTHGVKTGSEEEVSVTCVKNVNQFFCHLARNSDEIEKLADKVNSLCRQLEETKCPQTFGTVCFAKYTDGLWYRGQIKSTKPVVVNFVDYGDTLEVEKSGLLPVPIEAGDIMSVPVQAIECGLSDMPEDVPCEVEKWFQNFADGHCLTALIVAKEPGGKLLVELYEGKTQVNALIRQKFHNEIHRNQQNTFKESSSNNRSAQSVVAHVKEKTSGLKQELRNQVQQSGERHSTQRGNAVESKPMRSKWGSNTDGRQEPTRGFGKLDNSQRQHESPRMSNGRAEVRHPTSDKTEAVKPKYQPLLKESGLPVKLIKPGSEAEVFISHCNSPCSFFVQFASDEDDIYSLVEKLNADQPRCTNIDSSDIHEGDLVCAMFPDDNSWYRAAVRKNIGDKIDVEFVDFGNTAVVSASKICRLDQSYASIPRYSIHCAVHKLNAGSQDQEPSPNFKQVLEQNIEKVMCTFVKMSGIVWEVKLDVNGVVLGTTCGDDVPPTVKPPTPGLKHQTSDIEVCTFYRDPDITAGQMINGYTSCIKGPQLFWCQYAAMDKLQEISEALQSTGNVSQKMLSEDSVPVGSGCIALYTEDNLWYRAKVTSRDLDTLSITFVDYGNESKVNMGEVKAVPPQLSDVPPQAFSCQLEGFDLSKGFWDEKADDAFFELVNDKLLNITVEKIGDSETPHFVKLNCNGAVINDTMRSYWKSQSLETLSKAELVTADDTVADEVNIDSAVTIPTETDHADNETCTSVLEMQLSEQETQDLLTSTEVGIEILDDPLETAAHNVASPDEVSVVPSEAQEDVETTYITEDEPVLSSTGPSDTANQHAFAEGTDVDPTSFAIGVPQHPEEASSASSVNIDSFLIDNTDSQLCIEEPQSTSCEIIQSDLGCLRQVTEKLPVGSECVIWSHVRRNWCIAKMLKVYEDSALVLLVEHDSEVVVDPLNIYEILPQKPLQTASVPSDEVIKTTDAALEKSASKQAEDETTVALESEDLNVDEETCIDQSDPSDELPDQPQDEGSVSCSVVVLEDYEVEDTLGKAAQGHELVQVLSPEEVESTESLDVSAAKQKEDGAKMTTGVELLMDFLDVAPLDKVEHVCATELETDALLEEFNNVTEDLIVLTSDDGAESDAASDGTLQGDPVVMGVHPDADESSCIKEITSASDCSRPEDSRVTHLTLKVEDPSDDDVIFVGVLQESQAEVCEPECEKEKQKRD